MNENITFPYIGNFIIDNIKYCILFYKNDINEISFILLYNNYDPNLNHDINIIELPRLKTVPLLSLDEKQQKNENYEYIKDTLNSINPLEKLSIILSYDNKFVEIKFKSNKHIYIDYNYLIKLFNDNDKINNLIISNIRIGTADKINEFMITIDKKNRCIIFNSYSIIKEIRNTLFNNNIETTQINTYINKLLLLFNQDNKNKINSINSILYNEFILFLKNNNILYKKNIRLSEIELKNRNTNVL